MILISVDLPAPLSPSRPSTSPLRRCRLTSRSAVTGPKRLAMCSTRSTSSGAETRPDDRLLRTGAVSHCGAPAHALHVHVDGHRHDDRQAQVEQQVVGVDALAGSARRGGCPGTARRSARPRPSPSRPPAACRRSPPPRSPRTGFRWPPPCPAGPRPRAPPRGCRRSPPAVAQRMKLRIITRRTFTPASAAPSLFEPTATVYRPQRVNVSTICSTTTITSAQISSE